MDNAYGENAAPTKRSQNGTRKLLEIGLFPGKLALFELFCVVARRSLVENDRPPSFQGAPDPRKSAETTLAPGASAGVVVRVGAFSITLRGLKLIPIK
jgi:hypothetical protein